MHAAHGTIYDKAPKDNDEDWANGRRHTQNQGRGGDRRGQNNTRGRGGAGRGRGKHAREGGHTRDVRNGVKRLSANAVLDRTPWRSAGWPSPNKLQNGTNHGEPP